MNDRWTPSLAIPTRALVRASWQAWRNRLWRFSPARAGLWLGLLQLGLAALAIWRLGGQTPAGSPWPVILFGALQASLLAFTTLILRGRMQLYSGPLVQLIHLSPTPAQAAIAAEVLGRLPGRAWSATLFTAALCPALPAAAHPWAVPALWLAILLAGMLGHLAGLLVLIAWVRIAPRSLGAVWIGAMVATLALGYYLAYLLIAAIPVDRVAGALRGAGSLLAAGLALLFGLPGLAMAVRLLASPRTAGEAYREGWLGLVELGDPAARPRRSRWPRIGVGPAGVVAALAWLMALRNWISALRLGLWIACLAGIALAGPGLSRLEPGRQELFVLGLGLGAGLLNYGEQAAALFAADGSRVALFAVAGLKPHQLLLGKWLAAAPLALVSAVSAGVAAMAAGQGFPASLALASTALLIGLLSQSWLVGAAAFDARPADQHVEREAEQLAAAIEQAPTRPGGVVGLTGALAIAAAAVWLVAHRPVMLAPLALLPVGALTAGYLRLRHLFQSGFEPNG